MDDFDFDEEQQQQNDSNIIDSAINAKNQYNDAREKIDSVKKLSEKMKQGQKEAANKGVRGTGNKVATETGKKVTREAGKTVVKETGKTAAKEAGKVAAKEGTKVAAKSALAASGAVTAGVGTAAAVAVEAADRLNKARKKASDKIDNVIVSTTGLNVKGKKKFIIILIIFVIFFVITSTGTMYLASENTYNDLAAIIKKRQARYAESGKTFKSVLLMTNAEINEILTKDYLENGQTLVNNPDYSKLDLCYLTYLKNIYNREYDNFIPSDTNDPNSTYTEKTKIIEKYIKASRSNFNKIRWVLSGGTSGVEIKKYDLTDNLTVVSISGVAAALLNASDNYLSMPNLDKYKVSPSSSSEEMKSMYISMVEKYLQPWVVPYALNVASQNNDFGKSVLEDMYDPITVTLYELDRLTRTTITYYYLETTVTVDHYTEEKYDCEPNSSGGQDCSTRWVYTGTTYKDSTTATTWTDTDSERYSVSLKTGSDGGYIRAGIKSGPTVDRDQKPYRHVPKVTSAEAFYEVFLAKYAIKPINEANPPAETSTTLDADGKETIIDLFDETLTSVSTESKPYKVSYIGNENETYPRKSKSQKEQIKTKYVGTETAAPKIQGYSYDQLSFGFAQIEKYYNITAGGGVIGSSGGSLTNIPAGGFAWPVPAIITTGVNIDTTISSNFGPRVLNGKNEFHPAIDITAMGIGIPGDIEGVSYGPDIVAVQSGIVHIKHNPGGYGDNYVTIDHKNGYCTLYGHLFSISVTDGQEVTQGQTIGVMGTEGNSSGVHLHFGIYQSDSVDSLTNDKAIDPRMAYNSDGTSIGGVTNTGTNVVAATSNQPVMDQMCAKAQELNDLKNIKYNFGGETLSTIEELTKNPWNTDCSGFVSSMYKSYIGIDTGRDTGTMIQRGKDGYSENGWTAEYHDWDGDMSVLLPGDMLLRATHVGLYVGNGKQVDNGGPNEGDPGPNYKDARGTYTGYVRYTNPNVVSTTASTNTASTTNLSTTKGKKISRIEWYLDWQTAKNDTGGASGTAGGSTGTVGSWTVADIDNVAAQIEGGSGSWDLLSLIILEEGGVFTNDCSADGKQYKVENDGAGYPTLGPGICIKYNIDRLENHGVSDPESLSYNGDYVDKEIVIAVFNEEQGYYIDMVDKMLADNGITVESYQRDALISHAFNSGNVSGFAAAYKAANGDAQTVSNYFYGSGSAAGVEKRKTAEAQLYATGVYPETIY